MIHVIVPKRVDFYSLTVGDRFRWHPEGSLFEKGPGRHFYLVWPDGSIYRSAYAIAETGRIHWAIPA